MGGGGNPDNQAGYTSYDGNGNPATTQGGASLAFDASDKATLIGGNQVLSSYGPDGLRSEKTGATGNKFFAYNGLAPVVETSNNSSLTALNTFGPTGLISRYNPSNGVSTFYTPDERGNVAQRLDASGAVKSSDLYNAYGKRLSGGGAGDDPYGFAGMSASYTDSETGLSLLGQRFYDPSVSRFLNRDPSGYGGGMNLYRYAGNNPTNFSDPTGEFLQVLIGAGIGAVVNGGIAWYNGGSTRDILIASGKGAVIGGVVALTGGLAGGAAASMFGTSIIGSIGAGVVAGAVGDAAGQGVQLALGWRCSFSVAELGMSAAAATAFGTAQNAWTQGLIAGGLTFYQDEVDHFAADYGKNVNGGIVLEQIANGLGDGLAAMFVTVATARAGGTPFNGKIVKEATEILDHLTTSQITERINASFFAILQHPLSYIVKIIDGNIDASSEPNNTPGE